MRGPAVNGLTRATTDPARTSALPVYSMPGITVISPAKAGDAAGKAGMRRTVKICSAAPSMRRPSGGAAHRFWPTCPCGRSRRLAGEKATHACRSSANPRPARRGTAAVCAHVHGPDMRVNPAFCPAGCLWDALHTPPAFGCALPETSFRPLRLCGIPAGGAEAGTARIRADCQT